MISDKQILAALTGKPVVADADSVSPEHAAAVKSMLKMIGISVMARRPVSGTDWLTQRETVEVTLNGVRCPAINAKSMIRLAQTLNSLGWELSFEVDKTKKLKLVFITDSDAVAV